LLTLFRDRVKALYATEGVSSAGLQYEPRIAHQAMKSLLYETPNVTLYRRARLASVRMADGSRDRRVASVGVEELDAQGAPTGRTATLSARVFIDATDCGDLAAMAHAPYRIGREPRSTQEPHNGVIYYDRAHDKILPGSTGRGDRRIQAYSYLVTVKDYGPGADRTIPKPAGYRKEDYEHTPAWKDSWAVTSGKMPNGKYELNQHPQGGDLQEVNYGYPEGSYAERARIDKLYRDRALGYLYYIQTEQGQKQIGLPDDEYRDSGGFPPLLYVREGRRIVGEQTPVEADITKTRDRTHPESVGLGDYPMDSHAVRRKTDWTTPDMGEGEWWLYQYTPTHELPLGVIVPKALDNVFVTTAVSSTHVSFGTYRLEPVRIAFGQAAAIAAGYCIRYGLRAREVPARQIQDDLLPHIANRYGNTNVMLTDFSDVKPDNPHYRFIEYLAARGFRPEGDAFKPDAPTTRGELVRWMALLADRTPPLPSESSRGRMPGRGAARGGMPDLRPGAIASQPLPLAGAARMAGPANSSGAPSVRASAYMGLPADRSAIDRLRAAGPPEGILTRQEIAIALAGLLPPVKVADVHRFADIDAASTPLAAAAAQLAERGADPILWDGWSAIAPDGALLFRPAAPLRHDATFATLYLAQIGFGPAFFDHPLDGGKGRAVPSLGGDDPWAGR
ncbi:MAG TPA: FAD-dependent oxidoreductase, partial [Chthonomonadaceae bacterium]|nr:FAD-dependent oxidoreductase [Chthonomonadaceae bacterium]